MLIVAKIIQRIIVMGHDPFRRQYVTIRGTMRILYQRHVITTTDGHSTGRIYTCLGPATGNDQMGDVSGLQLFFLCCRG